MTHTLKIEHVYPDGWQPDPSIYEQPGDAEAAIKIRVSRLQSNRTPFTRDGFVLSFSEEWTGGETRQTILTYTDVKETSR